MILIMSKSLFENKMFDERNISKKTFNGKICSFIVQKAL